MSMTSCTSAAAAAAASSTLTRNSTASLYASINALHSDDGDARSGEEMGADDDDPQTMTSGTKGRRQEQCLLADVHQQIDRDKVSMNEKGPLHCQQQSGSGTGHVATVENDSRTVNSKSSSSTRRNKRKNFQPRNIRQSGSPDEDEDCDDDDDNDETEGDEDEEVNYDLLEGEDEEDLSISTSRANQKEPSPSVVLTPQNSSTSSTRKRRKSSNSSSSSSANILLHSQYPLDLREGPVLRHGRMSAFSQGRKDRHPEEEESNEERTSGRESDDDDDVSLRSDQSGTASAPMGAVDLSRASRRERSRDSDVERQGIRRTGALDSLQVDREDSSNLKMRTWMMLWQQQQQQQQPVSHLTQEQSEHLEQLRSSSHQQSSEPSNNHNFMMGGRMDPALVTKYAETTMRQLLSLYGLPQEAAAQLIAQQLPLGSSFLTPYAAAAAAAATAALTSTRSGSPPSRPPASSSTHTLSSGSGSGHQQSHQPPTPPHTPKTGNGSGTNTMAVAGAATHDGHVVPSISSYSSSASLTDRIPSSAGSCGDRVAGTPMAGIAMAEPEASLHALQAHMQSVLKATRASRGKSPTTSASNTIPTAETMRITSKSDRQLPPEGGSLISTTMAPFIGLDFHLEARSLDQASEQQHQSSKKYSSTSPNSVPITSSSSKNSKVGGGGGSRGTSGSGNGSSTGSSSKANPASIDYSRYVKRFGSAIECGSPYCKDLNYREHFHCLDCHPRVFVKKEEMIRHFKWHKKRDESLANGFMRYSPGDDCNDRYRGCPHNRKQTHYHCVMKSTCDKVYISTSDVQMHANYHRKDSAIMQEGFQRFRATEDCATDYCAFNGQRTTHFHCIRPPCNYTFKNKADMEKHKSYHIKDEQLARDGFKKFMKNEECQFEGCRFSRVCNHIHCVREHCNYVLHSSGQLYSHKRKHERRDAELASQGANAINQTSASHDSNSNSSSNSSNPASSMPSGTEDHQKPPSHGLMGFAASDLSRLMSDPSLAALLYGRMPSMLSQLEAATLQHQRQQQIEMQERVNAASLQLQHHQQQARMVRSPSPVMSEEDAFRLCLARVEAGKVCHEPNCQSHPHEHYHCRSDGCNLSFKSTEAAKEHWRNHEQQEHITDNYYISVDVDEEPNPCPTNCPFQTQQRHYHCCWENCKEIILASEKPFRRLDHYKMHEYSRKAFANRCATPPLLSTPPQFSGQSTPLSIPNPGMSSGCFTVGRETHSSGSINNTPSSAFSLDSMFRRKRGRPPKNRVIEVWNESSVLNHGSGQPDTPQAIFTSFKLPKPTTPPLSHSHHSSSTTSSSSLFIPQHSISALAQHHRTSSPSPTQGVSSLSHPVASSASSRSNKNQRISTSPSPERFHEDSGSKQLTGRSRASSADKNISPILHHHQKGRISPSGQSHPPPALPPSALRSPESPSKSSSITVVKAAGTFYPLSAFPSNKSSEGQALLPPPPNSSSSSSSSSNRDLSSPLPTSSVVTAVVQQVSSSFSSSLSSSSPSSSTSSPTTAIAAVAAASTTAATAAALISEKPVSYGPEQSCGRPFCKLKRREHYHCVICNQAFSEVERLKPHMLKHCSGALSPSMSQWASSCNNSFGHSLRSPSFERVGSDIKLEHTINQEDSKVDVEQPNLFGNISAGPSAAFLSNQEKDATARSSAALQALSFMPYGLLPPPQPSSGNGSSFLPPGFQSIYSNTNLLLANTMASFGRPGSPGSGLKRPSPSPIDHLMMSSPDSKKMRFQSSMRILKDEPVPDGYVRFRFNEDCQYGHCGYREHQTHFHCMRTDCGYSFCDKTRFVQHTARHERLDTLMGGDFQQYRANVGCGRPGCIYTASLGAVQNKASHFHCLKCDFVCTDTNKVVAHRRQHQKTNSIMAAGFEKFTPSQSCRIESCPHSNKQTHYHCLKCSYAVLGLAQMSAHKYRHLESSSPSATTTSA